MHGLGARVVVLALALVIAGVTAVEGPAVPLIDGCTGASIGLAGSQYSLSVCLAGYGGLIPIYSCQAEIAAVAYWEDQFEYWCNIEI
jgi:hypothetical protein